MAKKKITADKMFERMGFEKNVSRAAEYYSFDDGDGRYAEVSFYNDGNIVIFNTVIGKDLKDAINRKCHEKYGWIYFGH